MVENELWVEPKSEQADENMDGNGAGPAAAARPVKQQPQSRR